MFYLKKGEVNTWGERIKYMLLFQQYGIYVNLFSGNVKYLPFKRKCLCAKVDLVRHGKTEGIERKEFMSDLSSNAKLSLRGKKEVNQIIHQIRANLPDVILVGPLERTKETFDIIEKNIKKTVKTETCDFLRGINNSVWGGKTFEMLDSGNLWIFLQRECRHNIFAKTQGGDSWGDVIYRCIKLIKYLNGRYRNKKVLIISQGSVFQGLQIVLHTYQNPWENYDAEKMFSIMDKETNVEYGKIQSII